MENEEKLGEPLTVAARSDSIVVPDPDVQAADVKVNDSPPHPEDAQGQPMDEEKLAPVPVPVQEKKPVSNRLRDNVAARDRARDAVRKWNTGVHDYIHKTQEILNEVQQRVLEQNKVVSSEWKLVRAFYVNYMESFKTYGEGEAEADPKFAEKIKILQAREKKDGKNVKFSEFEKMLMNIHLGEQTRRKNIAEYKTKFKTEVIAGLENNLYKHPDIIECIKELKASATLKKELEGMCENTHASLKTFEKNFLESREVNNRGKKSNKCSFVAAHRFTTDVME